ncbi:hypothetical protein C8N29_10127 [Agitococcus lubricus]|uniref:Metal-dependent hydrolase n=2 Tax=Agitococcus lubricus TaxID=1077255 RepID=A0A2T5J341_9GAMM|nr:hypothetical protein C8N29_10127 [Agitococcus lubricus]
MLNTKSSPTTTRKLAGTQVGIPPRQMDFVPPTHAARYFFYNNATATLFFAVLSGIFPAGERFFVESVRRFRNDIKDETLKAQVSGFIGQEALHGREHDRLNTMLAERGFDMRMPIKGIDLSLWLLNQLPARQQLACTIFMEHFTALLAEQWLSNIEFQQLADPDMIKLWQWHALEELEHKSVAYDVYDLIGNKPYERVLAALYVIAAIAPTVLASWAYLVAREHKPQKWRDIKQGITILLGKKGFITTILPQMPVFFQKKFHPKQHNTQHLESMWRDKLFGEFGTLLSELKNPDAVRLH